MTKICVFTGSGLRHQKLIERLAEKFEDVLAVIETPVSRSSLPNVKNGLLEHYFSIVHSYEKEIFSIATKPLVNVHYIELSYGALATLDRISLERIQACDQFIVFGSSYIKGPLCEYLLQRKAINLHIGVSPFYRGSACNFWAAWDGRFDLMGATIHLLSTGLDSGSIIAHALPAPNSIDAMDLAMRTVDVGQKALIQLISSDNRCLESNVTQDLARQIRYSKIADFNESVAKQFLSNRPNPRVVCEVMTNRNLKEFINPMVLD